MLILLAVHGMEEAVFSIFAFFENYKLYTYAAILNHGFRKIINESWFDINESLD